MISNNRTARQQHNPLTIHDPTGEYEFEVVLDALDDQDGQSGHFLLATKQCHHISEVPGVDWTTPGLYSFLSELLSVEVVDENTGSTLSDCSVDLTFVLKMDRTGHYHPQDVLVDDQRLSEYDSESGFLNITDHLKNLIDRQTRGLNHTQVPY